MLKTKLSTALYLAVVFLSGALVGGFAYRLYSVNTVTATASRRPDPVEWRRHYMDEMRARVKVDEQQVAQINEILDETGASFANIHERERKEAQIMQNAQIAKIFALLRPDQRPLYAQLRQERQARRKAQLRAGR